MAVGDRLIVLNNDEDSVGFIDVESGRCLHTISVGGHPHEVAIAPDLRTVYVSNAMGNSLSVIDAATVEETERIEHAEFQFPHDIKISPDGSKLYVVVTYAAKLFIYARPSHELLKILPTGQRLSHMLAPTPDWRHIYIPNLGSHTLSVFNTETEEIEKHIVVGKGTEGVAVHPSGAFLYVANNKTSDVSLIDLEALKEIGRFDAGIHPDGLGYLPAV